MSKDIFRPLASVIGNSTLRVEYSDLTILSADVLVSSDDVDLSMGGGASDALLRAGGEEVWREARRWAPIELGNVAITTAGRLNAKHIFHAAVLDYGRIHLTTIDLIRKVTKKCLMLCDQLGYQSIAFPALATGAAGLSPERSAVAMMLEIVAHLNHPTNVKFVTIALYPRFGLDKSVLPQFYSQVSDFLEMAQRLANVTSALDNLERVYRSLSIDNAADSIMFSREDIRRKRASWEREILQQEPQDLAQESLWRRYHQEIEPDLQRISSLNKGKEELDQIIARRGNAQTWEQLAHDYKEYRSKALQEMIILRRRNITDLELEQARGFSVEINRKLEYERQELNRLDTELQELK